MKNELSDVDNNGWRVTETTEMKNWISALTLTLCSLLAGCISAASFSQMEQPPELLKESFENEFLGKEGVIQIDLRSQGYNIPQGTPVKIFKLNYVELGAMWEVYVIDAQERVDIYHALYNPKMGFADPAHSLRGYINFGDKESLERTARIEEEKNREYWVKPNIREVEPSFSIPPNQKVRIVGSIAGPIKMTGAEQITFQQHSFDVPLDPQALEDSLDKYQLARPSGAVAYLIVEDVEVKERDTIDYNMPFLTTKEDVSRWWKRFVSERFSMEPTTHEYRLNIVDFDGRPVQDALISYQLTTEESDTRILQRDTLALTSQTGDFVETFDFTGAWARSSHLSYVVGKKDHYSVVDSSSIFVFDGGASTRFDTLRLLKPADYFDRDFWEFASSARLRSNLLEFLDWLRLEALGTFSLLEYHSIDLITFKEKKYLTYTFEHDFVYDLEKFSKYEIGARLFTDMVRQVLGPLDRNLSRDTTFFGYDIRVHAFTSHPSRVVTYRFMMPRTSVTEYKNLDITGQRLLNDSIILMDDERVELTLQ